MPPLPTVINLQDERTNQRRAFVSALNSEKTYESVQNDNCRVAGDEFTSPDRARQRGHRQLFFTEGDRDLHSLISEKDQTFELRVLLFTFLRHTLTAELATDRPIDDASPGSYIAAESRGRRYTTNSIAPNMSIEEVRGLVFAQRRVKVWGGLNPAFDWPSARGVIYKTVVQWYEEGEEDYFQLVGAASKEIWARGEYADELEEWIEVTYEKKKVLHKELGELQVELTGVVDELRVTKKEVKVLRAKFLKSEVAREKAEAEWKTLVEQRDKWRQEAEKTKKEKDKLEKDLRQELWAAKLAARRAPMVTSATQTHSPPPLAQLPLRRRMKRR